MSRQGGGSRWRDRTTTAAEAADAADPLRVVDEGIAVVLYFVDGVVPCSLKVIDGVQGMPFAHDLLHPGEHAGPVDNAGD